MWGAKPVISFTGLATKVDKMPQFRRPIVVLPWRIRLRIARTELVLRAVPVPHHSLAGRQRHVPMPRFVRRHAAASARGVLAHLAWPIRCGVGARPWRTVLVGAMLILAATWLARPATAQALLAEEEKQELGKKKDKQQPFALLSAKPETLEALEDFRRAVRKAAWDKAFSQIEKLISEQTVGLVPSSGGLHVPLRAAVAVDLAALPPGGQEAYRLFHDAEAKKLWEELQKEIGQEEMTKLSRLATLDLITSVGDLAANRLGDALFEQGDLLGAVDAWQRILNYRPDSSLPRAQLLTKIGIALADAGRWIELADVERELKERYAGERVTVGGAKVVATDEIAALVARHAAAPAGTAGRLPADLVLPDNTEPVWQFRFDSKDPKEWQRVNFGWWMWGRQQSTELFNTPVSAAVTDTLLYANWMGCDFAIELASGKLKWRNGRFNDVAQRIMQQQRHAAGRFVQGGGRRGRAVVGGPAEGEQPERQPEHEHERDLAGTAG